MQNQNQLGTANKILRWLAAVLTACIFSACAVNSVGIRDQLAQNSWQEALAEINATYGDEPVLYSIQAGTALYRAGEYEASNQALDGLATAMEELRGVSVTETASSALVNDNTRSYEATDFEMAAAKALQIINYLALNQLEDARIEARQADEILLNELKAADQFAFIHMLVGMVYEMTGEYGQALVSYRNAVGTEEVVGNEGVNAYATQSQDERDVAAPAVAQQAYADLLLQQGLVDELQRSGLQGQKRPENAVQVFGIFSGSMVSARQETNIQHFSADAGDNFAISIPHYPEEEAPGFVPSTNLANGLITSMEQQQRAALADLRPAIIARTVARLIVKQQTQALAEQQGGELAGFAAGVVNNATEQADTRSADLLPAQLYFVREVMSQEDFNQRVLANEPAFKKLAVPDLAHVNDGLPTYFAVVDQISGVVAGNPNNNQVIVVTPGLN